MGFRQRRRGGNCNGAVQSAENICLQYSSGGTELFVEQKVFLGDNKYEARALPVNIP